ncbi:MAG: hypothetical protein ACSHX7_10305 [Luteolibacter sp.]
MPPEDKSTPENSFYTPGETPAPQPPQDHSPATEASDVEVLEKEDTSGELAPTPESPVKRFTWLPWRRPNPRDHQIAQLRDGYIELVDLVRNINHHLDRQKTEASQVSGLVQSLPPVLASFEKLAESQEQGTAILGRIDTHMAAATKKDEKLMENMNGFNTTIKEVSETNRGAIGALERVQTKIETSEDRMSSLFDQANKNSESVGGMMMRLEKRLFLSNLALILLLVILIGLGIFWSTRFAVKSTLDESPPAAPVAQAAAVQETADEAPQEEAEVAPASPSRQEELPEVSEEEISDNNTELGETTLRNELDFIEAEPESGSPETEMKKLIEELEEITEELPEASEVSETPDTENVSEVPADEGESDNQD